MAAAEVVHELAEEFGEKHDEEHGESGKVHGHTAVMGLGGKGLFDLRSEDHKDDLEEELNDPVMNLVDQFL